MNGECLAGVGADIDRDAVVRGSGGMESASAIERRHGSYMAFSFFRGDGSAMLMLCVCESMKNWKAKFLRNARSH